MSRRRFVPLFEKPLTWVDTETTGLDHLENDIIEIAIIRVENDGTEKVLHLYIDMERPENAHPRALEVNGYTPEAWAANGALKPAEAWKQVAESGLLNEAIIAGQNVRFDAGFINASFKRHGIETRMDYHLYDTCSLALEHLRPWMDSISLVPLCVALAIPVNNAHTALADVRMAMEVEMILARAMDADREQWSRSIPRRLAAWKAAGRPNTWPQV
jgi:DNA polymerase III epsilon subunit-like protein